jgi:hypothetical protein
MIWREKRILLIVLVLILLANVVFFFTYRVQYQSRLDELDTRLDQAQSQLDAAKKSRLAAENTMKGFRDVEKDVALVYDQYWSTEGARLTEMIGEIKHLAVASNLIPESYSFDRREAVGSENASNATRREGDVGAIEVGVRFGVAGTYAQARRLINLLELSQQFVIIDQISLSAAEGEQLSLALHLKTLFRDVAANPQTAPKNRS